MDYTRIMQSLLTETNPMRNVREMNRRLLTFHDPQLYQECIREWIRLVGKRRFPSSVNYSPLTQTIIAPAPQTAKFEAEFRNELMVEEDDQVHIQAIQGTIGTLTGIPWGIKQIKAPQAWSISTGHRMKIAVIDTGVDFAHPDLKYSLTRGINLVHRNIPPYDDNGHGTHISGTIAAANSTQGMIGVAPRSVVYPVKAFDHNGSAFVSDIILAIDWCVRAEIDIINMSFGMQTRSRALLDVVGKANQAGVIIVASSGNDGKRRTADYPARYPQTISVGATDRNRKIPAFSNRGQFVDIYAPGDKIVSAWLQGKYHEMSGTSMATSHVSGAIALLLAQKPDLKKTATIKALLRRTSSPLKLKKGYSVSDGEVNALKFLREGMKL
ncbi:S8 family peptidase [Paenibacillus sp. p3-SID867]|uniref:S8 family peptidase n=1 Tax=Paenibacillus sp. p3-SID867 TaxID=2916363 RepID=UPI0021A44F75|nr:S8 family peptidase [Paenibacillus sp. p3-SID867]MCT1404067.1 S8 family peptidase [Paenibacillus sp. p3-SID867]